MRRVLAVLISVLTAVWPLLLPQPVSANPCGVTTAEGVKVYASGSTIDQSGWAKLDNSSGDANGGFVINKAAASAAAAAAGGGEGGPGGNATNYNNPVANGGTAIAAQVGVNAQRTKNEGEIENSNTAGGNGGYANAWSGGAYSNTEAENEKSGNAVSLLSGNSLGGDGGNAGNGLINLLPIHNDANGAQGGSGGDTEGKAYADADSKTGNYVRGGSADGGDGGDMKNRATQINKQSVSNDDNSAYAKGGKNTVTSENTGGNGGNGGNAAAAAAAAAAAGTGNGGNGGNTAERTADNSRQATTEGVTNTVSFGGASGDPCKQIIKDSVGVMAINGVNDIRGSVMQNVNANVGNAANTSLNMTDLSKSFNIQLPYDTKVNGGYPSNVNVNPNTNQNTNVIGF